MRKVDLHKVLWLSVLCLLIGACLISSVGLQFQFPELFPDRLSIEKWKWVFQSDGLLFVLARSILISITVAIAATFLAFFVGFRRKDVPLSNALTAFYLPYLVSPVIFAVCLQIFLLRMDLAGQVSGVIIGQLCVAFPYAVILQNGIWTPRLFSMISLSRNLGASQGYSIRRIILPYAKGLLTLCLIQCFMISWFDFAFAQILGMGQVKTMTVALYQSVLEADLSIAAISAIMIFIPPVLLLSLNVKNLRGAWRT